MTIQRKKNTNTEKLNFAEIVLDSVPASSPTTEVRLYMIARFLLARFIWQENTPKMQMESKHAFTGLSAARETQKEQTFNS